MSTPASRTWTSTLTSPIPRRFSRARSYTVYDSDWYVIGAVVIGEARGVLTANYAYITSSAKSEEMA